MTISPGETARVGPGETARVSPGEGVEGRAGGAGRKDKRRNRLLHQREGMLI